MTGKLTFLFRIDLSFDQENNYEFRVFSISSKRIILLLEKAVTGKLLEGCASSHKNLTISSQNMLSHVIYEY